MKYKNYKDVEYSQILGILRTSLYHTNLMHIYITGIFVHYSKCSNILNTFLFLFSDNMLVIKAGAHKTLVRITKKKGRP